MRKKRLRKPADPDVLGRRARVRNRLLAGVLLGSVAVLAAGAPGLLDTSAELSDHQDLVDLARLNQKAVALAHSLADERQAVLTHLAGGRATAAEDALTGAQRAQVDRQVKELRANAPERVRRLVDGLPELRRQSLAGESDQDTAHREYTKLIQELNDVGAQSARALPGAAANRTAQALPFLVRAVEQAAATRGLLTTALLGQGEQRASTAGGQRTYLREQAALADFGQLADPAAQDSYQETVTGHEVELADRYLATLTDEPRLGAVDQRLDQRKVQAALAARIDLMRAVSSTLAVDEVERLEQLRDEAVTDLEVEIALLGAALLLAVGSGVQTARSMARPLAVLRRGAERVAADPAGEEPVGFTGRDDEFADVVRAVNRLQQSVLAGRRPPAGTEPEPGRELERPAGAGDAESLAAAALESFAAMTRASRTRRATGWACSSAGTAEPSAGTAVQGDDRSRPLAEPGSGRLGGARGEHPAAEPTAPSPRPALPVRRSGTPSRVAEPALADDPLVDAAQRAEQLAHGAALAPVAGRSGGPTEAPSGPARGELVDELAADEPDALIRAAGPFLVESDEHARPTADDALTQPQEPETVRPAPTSVSGHPSEVPAALGDDRSAVRHGTLGTGTDARVTGHSPAARSGAETAPTPAPTDELADWPGQPPPSDPPRPERALSDHPTAAGGPARREPGAPHRTPRSSAAAPRPTTAARNAEELRRRLGGFQRGARDGRRDAEVALASRAAEPEPPRPTAERSRSEPDDGGGGPPGHPGPRSSAQPI